MASHPITPWTLVLNPSALHDIARVVVRRVPPTALGYVGLGCAALSFLALHVFAPATLDPLRQPMSDYGLADRVGWLFVVGVGFIAVGGFGAMHGLARAGLLGNGLLRLSMIVIVVSAVVTAVFPTDESFPLSLTAEIHRYAAITLFIAVPVAAGAAVAAPGRDGWLLGTTLLVTGVLTVFLLSHLSVMPQDMQDLRGLFQRVLVVLDLAVLGRLCAAGGNAEHAGTSAGHDVLGAGHSGVSVGHDAAGTEPGGLTCTHAYVLVRGEEPDRSP